MNQKQISNLKAGDTIYIVKKTYGENFRDFKHRLFPIKIVEVTLRRIKIRPYLILGYIERWKKSELKDFSITKWDAWHKAQEEEKICIKNLRKVIVQAKSRLEYIKVEKRKYKQRDV